MKNYFMIPMKFKRYCFKKLEQEYETNGVIWWQIPGVSELENSELAGKIKVGDIIYFYVCDLPSQDGQDRALILLRGVVVKEPEKVENKKVYWYEEDASEGKIIGFPIGKIETLGGSCYDKDFLEKKYGQRYPQGKRWPNTGNGNLDSNLVEDLEKSFEKSGANMDLQSLIRNF